MKYVKISAYDTVTSITRGGTEEIIRRVEIDLTLPNQYEEYLLNMSSGFWFGISGAEYITFQFYRFVFHQKRTWYDNPLQALYNFHTGLDLVNFDFHNDKERVWTGSKVIKAWEDWNMPLPSMNKFLGDFIESVDRKFYSQTYKKDLKELLGCIKQNAFNTTPETLYGERRL